MQKFIMLIGPSGCGKSTWANGHVYDRMGTGEIWDIHSSDAIRGEVWGNENVQGDPAQVFIILHTRVMESLAAGHNVIYDATNLSRKRRRGVLKTFKTYCEAHNIEVNYRAVIIVTSFEDCWKNNGKRTRKVPRDVIVKQFKDIILPWFDEGWNDINFYLNSELMTWGNIMQMLDIPHNNEHHQRDVLEHSLSVAAAMGEPFSEHWKVGMLHDLGKPFTKDYMKLNGKNDNQAHYYGHCNVGAYLSLLVDDDFSNSWDNYKRAMVIQYHMEPFLRDEKALKSLYEWIGDEEIVGLIQKLNKADKEWA